MYSHPREGRSTVKNTFNALPVENSMHLDRSRCKKPIGVVLGGWLGCTPRALSKYSALYQGAEFILIEAVIAPPTSILQASRMEDAPLMREIALRIRHKLLSAQHMLAGFVIHSFSNGGCFLYEIIKKSLYRRDFNLEIPLVGTIFDSSPAFYSGADETSLQRAMAFTSRLDRWQLWWRSLFETHEQKNTRILRAVNYWRWLREDQSPIPQLYLFSDVDDLAPLEPLTDLIEYRKKTFAAPIFSCKFHMSPHCCHLLTQPYMYALVLRGFLNVCKSKSCPSTYGGTGVRSAL